jgi:hypothetical protein
MENFSLPIHQIKALKILRKRLMRYIRIVKVEKEFHELGRQIEALDYIFDYLETRKNG